MRSCRKKIARSRSWKLASCAWRRFWKRLHLNKREKDNEISLRFLLIDHGVVIHGGFGSNGCLLLAGGYLFRARRSIDLHGFEQQGLVPGRRLNLPGQWRRVRSVRRVLLHQQRVVQPANLRSLSLERRQFSGRRNYLHPKPLPATDRGLLRRRRCVQHYDFSGLCKRRPRLSRQLHSLLTDRPLSRSTAGNSVCLPGTAPQI